MVGLNDADSRQGPPAADENVFGGESRLAKVERVRSIAGSARSLVFAFDDGGAVGHRPGQYVALAAGDGTITLPIADWSRDASTFELVAAPDAPGSECLQGLEVGDRVTIRGPLGNALPLAAMVGNDVLVLVNGNGMAAARPLMQFLLAERARYGKIALLYGAPEPSAILFNDELEAWAKEPGVNVKVTVERGGEGWQGYIGVPTMLIPRLEVDPGNLYAYLAGPSNTYKFMTLAVRARSVPEDRILVLDEARMQAGGEAVLESAALQA